MKRLATELECPTPSADSVVRAGANSGLGNTHCNVEKTIGER
jgi:hypothetical protein